MSRISLSDEPAKAKFIRTDRTCMIPQSASYVHTSKPVMDLANMIWSYKPSLKLPIAM